MIARFSVKAAASATALAMAMLVAGCGSGSGSGSGSDLNQAAAANQNVAIPAIAPPAGQEWTRVVQETPEGGYRMGNPDAPVKLVEYASIGCHVCADFSTEGHDALTNRYVKSGQVSWEYRPYVLFPTDPGMFLLLRCQGPQPFFGMTEQLYATQREWMGRAQQLSAEQLNALSALPQERQVGALVKAIGMDQYFRQRGVPQARVDQCLSDTAGLQRLVELKNRGDTEGVRGTPTFFINGTRADVTAWSALEPQLRAAIGG